MHIEARRQDPNFRLTLYRRKNRRGFEKKSSLEAFVTLDKNIVIAQDIESLQDLKVSLFILCLHRSF
jgi:hypothetical protein